MKKLLVILFVVFAQIGFGQQSDSILIFDDKWFKEEIELEKKGRGSIERNFVGGREEFSKAFLNTLVFPEDAKKNGISGTVYYEVEIDTNGSICRFILLRGICPSIDKEIENKIYLMKGKWKPLIINNNKVNYFVTESVKFSYH